MLGMNINMKNKRLQKILAAYPSKSRKVSRASLQKAALLVQNKGKKNSPYLTGNLRRSITHQLAPNKALVGTNVIYARVREFNTKRMPKGYLRPALENSRKEIRKIFANGISKTLRP